MYVYLKPIGKIRTVLIFYYINLCTYLFFASLSKLRHHQELFKNVINEA